MSAKETFSAVLSNGPLIRGDVIVVLSGDGDTRLEVGMEIIKQRAADNILVSGGVDDPPHALTADASRKWLINKGLHRSRIIMEPDSQNTREQAVNVVAMAQENGGKRCCSSPAHITCTARS